MPPDSRTGLELIRIRVLPTDYPPVLQRLPEKNRHQGVDAGGGEEWAPAPGGDYFYVIETVTTSPRQSTGNPVRYAHSRGRFGSNPTNLFIDQIIPPPGIHYFLTLNNIIQEKPQSWIKKTSPVGSEGYKNYTIVSEESGPPVRVGMYRVCCSDLLTAVPPMRESFVPARQARPR